MSGSRRWCTDTYRTPSGPATTLRAMLRGSRTSRLLERMRHAVDLDRRRARHDQHDHIALGVDVLRNDVSRLPGEQRRVQVIGLDAPQRAEGAGRLQQVDDRSVRRRSLPLRVRSQEIVGTPLDQREQLALLQADVRREQRAGASEEFRFHVAGDHARADLRRTGMQAGVVHQRPFELRRRLTVARQQQPEHPLLLVTEVRHPASLEEGQERLGGVRALASRSTCRRGEAARRDESVMVVVRELDQGRVSTHGWLQSKWPRVAPAWLLLEAALTAPVPVSSF